MVPTSALAIACIPENVNELDTKTKLNN